MAKFFKVGQGVVGLIVFKKVFVFKSPVWMVKIFSFFRRISFTDGLCFEYNFDKYGESWSVLKVGGSKPNYFGCSCDHDCCGHTFLMWYRSYFGFIHIVRLGINV